MSTSRHQPAHRPHLSLLLTATMLVAVLMPVAALPVAAGPNAAGAVASGFTLFKYPSPQPLCEGLGLNVSNAPYINGGQCGFYSFLISGAGPTASVTVDFETSDGNAFDGTDASFDAVNGDWSFRITPTDSWPAGYVTARVFVDGSEAGTATFGHQVLGATMTLDESGAPYRPGDDLAFSGTIAQLDSAANLGPVLRTGVPATFDLKLIAPDGTAQVLPGSPLTADADGTFAGVVPGALTEDLTPVGGDLELTVAIAALNATYDDGGTTWAAADAGRLPVSLIGEATALSLRTSFVSSTGWVKPGESFPFRVFVTNATSDDATNVTVTVTAPPSASFLDATPLQGGGTATTAASTVTWNVGTLPAATEAGPMVRTLVVTARAASLGQDPEVVWKDLSTAATLAYSGYSGPAIASATHGPKVIPPDGGFETARYGDKPFPMVPVEYVDLERQSNETWDNDAEKLDAVVNDPGFVGSTLNLYQEMSYGQLFPHGTVPSAGIASATFSGYEPGYDFTTPDRTDPLSGTACRGVTAAEVDGVIGSAAFDTRIQDGWYQLPGTTEYYGGDWPVFTATTIAIDSACGPLGKAVFDAAQIADPEIDYNQYDSDKDGVVDFFMLVFVGCGGNGPSQVGPICQYFGNQAPFYDNIWPHSSSLEAQYTDPSTGLRGYTSDDQLKSLSEVPQCWTSGARLQFDDCAADGGTGQDSLPVLVRVGPYNVNPETVFQSASVISHEYGHHLGLPDFYDSSGEVYGDLNLMAADYSQHMTIFGKQELGWVVPDYLQPGDSLTVNGWDEIKADTGAIHWQRPDGTPYTLSAADGDQNIHNGQAYGLKLPGRQLIDPAAIPSGTHAWWSGRGNDFGCSPSGAHNLDLYLPELASVPGGTPVTLEFNSSWDIEWDWDYGFVMTSVGGSEYTSQVSENGYTTDNAFNPNRIECMTATNNGITGTSGAWEQGPAIVTASRAPNLNDYSHGAPFLADAYDITELAGEAGAVVRFSYFTDGAFDRPGWFIDDIVVRAGGEVIYASDFEANDEDGRLFPGGCGSDGSKVAATCTEGWSRIQAGDAQSADHAYYLELRDQSGFDFDGHDQSDRGDTSWEPGLFIEYTDEAHGYGNNGTPPPPAQHYVDSEPIPGSDCVSEQGGNCADVSFTAASGDNHFSDAVTEAQPGGFVNSFSNPDSAYGDTFWHFDYGCLTLDVTSMLGEDIGPEEGANLSADASISAGTGCAEFGYGRTGGGENAAPVADAQARPETASAGEQILFDGSGSTDDRTPASELEYSWDFGDGQTGTGQSVHHAYDVAGEYTATLTVTDDDGLTGTDTVVVTVTGAPDLVVDAITTVQNTGNPGGKGKQPKEGDKVIIRATIKNEGTAAAPATSTSFSLDGQPMAGSPKATMAIPAGGTVTVDLDWDTRGVKGEHAITVAADAGGAVAESREGNNAGTLPVSVHGNKVANGDFEQSNADESGPEAWTGQSTGAGTASWSEAGGTDGSHAAAVAGTRKSAVLNGVPTWTSAPIDVAAGSLMTLRVTVSTVGASSAPAAGLAYLGPAGELLSTVRLIDVPLSTDGFTTLEKLVTLPPGVAQVRVILFGFAANDVRTTGTVTFDDVGLFEE